MKQQLREMVTAAVEKLGKGGTEKFATSADVSPTLVRQLIRRGQLPTYETVLKIALACGLSDEDAHRIASGCALERVKKPA